MTAPAIETSGLTKVFNGAAAVDHVELTVPAGSVFGFLGPNGAGKTTTARMLVGLARPTSGTATILGFDITKDLAQIRKRIGFLPDVPAFYSWMTGLEYLLFVADVFGIKTAEAKKKAVASLERAGLKGVKTKIGGYSRGMKQRLGIAQALINDPKVILTDEPTSALDPIGRKEVLETISSLGGEITVFFSTHILNDVERVCDNVAILNKGKILADETLESLKSRHAAKPAFRVELEIPRPDFLERLKGEKWAAGVETSEQDTVIIAAEDLQSGRAGLLKLAAEMDIPVKSLEVVEQTLEDIFMGVIGKA